jgi:hypothetical protein
MGQTAIAASYKNRRAAERIATSLRGKVFPGPVDCVVADFSKLGARLRFETPPPAGERLIMVVWSSGVAVRRPAPPHLAEIQALWIGRRPKVGRRAMIASPVILQSRTRWPRRIASGP